MKHIHRYLLILLVAAVGLPESVCGESFRIVFKRNAADATTVLQDASEFQYQIIEGSDYYSTVKLHAAVFAGTKGLLLGRSSGTAGRFTLTLNQSYHITNIAIEAHYRDSGTKIICGKSAKDNSTSSATLTGADTVCTFTFDGSEISSFYVATSAKRAYISAIEVTYINPESLEQLSIPTGLVSTLDMPTTVTLSWDAMEHASKYQVRYGVVASEEEQTADVTGNTLTLKDLAESTEYWWRVQAISDGISYRDSEESSEMRFTTGALAQYKIRWMVNGEQVQEEVVKDGKTMTIMPTTPEDNTLGGRATKFMGWSCSNTGVSGTNTAPADLFKTLPTTSVSGDLTYYAVFATQQSTQSYKKVESEPEDWSGEYIIVYNGVTEQYAMNTHYGNNNKNTYSPAQNVSKYYDATTQSFSHSDMVGYQYSIAPSPNGYSIRYDAEQSYLGVNTEAQAAASGDYLRWDSTYSDIYCEWTLSYEGNHVYIRNNYRTIYYIMAAYSSVSSTRITYKFKTCQKDNGYAIDLYRLDNDYADYVTEGEKSGGSIRVTEWTKTGVYVVVNGSCDAVYAAIPTIENGVVSQTRIEGTAISDSTFMVNIPDLETLASGGIGIYAMSGSQLASARHIQVPIVVDSDMNTSDLAASSNSTCNIIVRDGACLTHNSGGLTEYRNIDIYAGGCLDIPSGTTCKIDTLRLYADNDNVATAITNNSAQSNADISINQVVHVKEIDGHYWYPFSLPYDCKIKDIVDTHGNALGTYSTDWGIKYYDGLGRQRSGSSSKPGENSQWWKMMDKDSVLRAGIGYIIGLFYADESVKRSIEFTPTQAHNYTEVSNEKVGYIDSWGENLESASRHHGWNFVGLPWISSLAVGGNWTGSITMTYIGANGEQLEHSRMYVSIPEGGGKNTYRQVLVSDEVLMPFSGYFVQALDPLDGVGGRSEVQYTRGKSGATLLSSSVSEEDEDMYVVLRMTRGSAEDKAGVIVGNGYTTGYEIGDDLEKMLAEDVKVQLWTESADGERYAYQAVPETASKEIALGIYVPSSGDYVLEVDNNASTLLSGWGVRLRKDGKEVADMLNGEYKIAATNKGELAGYTLEISKQGDVATVENANGCAENGSVQKVLHNGQILVLRDGVAYDMFGRQVN